MKIKHFYTILFVAVIAFLGFTAFTVQHTLRTNEVENNKSRIKFSHKIHAEITDCKGCHTKAGDAKTMKDQLLPKMEDCATCHDVENTDECNKCHYESVQEPLIQKKSSIIFSHSFHIGNKVECTYCHKGMDNVDYAFESVGSVPSMETCSTCHGEKKTASLACEACHISTANLLPKSHNVVDFKKSHKFLAERPNANCVMCHDNNSCEECHTGTTMITETGTWTNFYAPYKPHTFVDGTKQQQISRVHDLNFQFTHGIEAKGKESNCQSCHQVETFCVSCHENKTGDLYYTGIKPKDHTPDFANFSFGVGSGGGEHSVLARRDIERCASCHETSGADPVCIQCHLDIHPGKGNDNKTHATGFMKNDQGDWHDSEGSVCYTCHVGASPNGIAGVGFCGYCHGSQAN
ncbi:MAG: cytochrome c3 family protein [Ignavibacteria bacterium]|nr:cytochrome c3 family protein [Ignavibacteria bacterium]